MHIQLKMKYLFNQIRCHFETVLKLMVFLVEGMKLKVFETASPSLSLVHWMCVCVCVSAHLISRTSGAAWAEHAQAHASRDISHLLPDPAGKDQSNNCLFCLLFIFVSPFYLSVFPVLCFKNSDDLFKMFHCLAAVVEPLSLGIVL